MGYDNTYNQIAIVNFKNENICNWGMNYLNTYNQIVVKNFEMKTLLIWEQLTATHTKNWC